MKIISVLFVYQYMSLGEMFMSNIVVNLNHYPPTIKDVRNLEDRIHNKHGYPHVTVTNWLLLGKED